MTKLLERTQFDRSSDFDYHIYKCWCGEDSFLEISIDKDDGEAYITITQHPTRLLERLQLAWKSLRGLEFSSANSVIISQEDLGEFLNIIESEQTNV